MITLSHKTSEELDNYVLEHYNDELGGSRYLFLSKEEAIDLKNQLNNNPDLK